MIIQDFMSDAKYHSIPLWLWPQAFQIWCYSSAEIMLFDTNENRIIFPDQAARGKKGLSISSE